MPLRIGSPRWNGQCDPVSGADWQEQPGDQDAKGKTGHEEEADQQVARCYRGTLVHPAVDHSNAEPGSYANSQTH